MKREPLRDRWTGEFGQTTARNVVEWLLTGRDLDGLEIHEHEGRADLRFLPVSASAVIDYFMTERGWFVEHLGGVLEFRNRALERLDLRGAELEHLRFFDCDLVDCRFDGATCADWRMWNTRVTGCTFVGADLRDSALGTWHDDRRNEWRGVQFCEAVLRNAHATMAMFQDCDFTKARMERFDFRRCEMRRVQFGGGLSQVLFDGRPSAGEPAPPPMEDVDFSQARFSEVAFMGWPSLTGIDLPSDPDVLLVRCFRRVAEHACGLLADDNSTEARQLRGVLESRMKAMRAADEDTVLNRRDFAKWGGPPLLDLAESVLLNQPQDISGDA